MDKSKHQENDDNVYTRIGCKTDNMESPSVCDALKFCLLKYAMHGVDKVFNDRKRLKKNPLVTSKATHQAFEKRKGKKEVTLQENKWVTGTKEDISSDQWNSNNGHAGVSQVVNSPSEGYNQIYFNFAAFFSVLLMKFLGFQFNLLVSFFAFSIWLPQFSWGFLMYPFETLKHIRGYFMKTLLRFLGIYSKKVSEKAQKSIRKIAFRLGCGIFWSSYVFVMLSELLAFGFACSGLMMRNIVEIPVETREILNFDYTKISPVAYVPMGLISNDYKEAGARVIPYKHKLQLTVSMTMPESEYNRQLGIFQVRVELMTANGKVTGSSSKPCLLQIKSSAIRTVETVIKSVAVISGFGSESQTLNIKMVELTEGIEPTEYLKVTMESRAEHRSVGSSGIPEIYGASLSLQSDIPLLKRFIWKWRRTIFVWTSFFLFFTELIFILLFFKPLLIPGGRPRTKLLVYK